MLRKVRSLWDQRVRKVSSKRSRKFIQSGGWAVGGAVGSWPRVGHGLLQEHFPALFQAFDQFGFHTVRDPEFRGDFSPAVLGFGVGDLQGSVAVCVASPPESRDDRNRRVFL